MESRAAQRGIVLPLMAISTLVLLGMAGLVVDLGQAYARKSELQNVLDAAALSGAKVLNDTGAPDQAQAAVLATYNGNMPALFLEGDTAPVVEMSDTYPFVAGGPIPNMSGSGSIKSSSPPGSLMSSREWVRA